MKSINKNKKLIVKVNKFALSLVIAMFLFEFLIALEFNSGIVSAAVANANNTMDNSKFTYNSNPQYTRPGVITTYSQQYATAYWPDLANPQKCQATSDFIMNVQPFSCVPLVVRSDLLEEQNVPVFCKVNIIKLNPLIDVSQLKSITYKDTSNNPLIAGVNFHPNAEAIYSQQGFLNNPVINNAGYVVVVLKRIPNEKDMPDSIRLNLTGVLKYDSEGIFGAGQSEYYLDVIDDKTWATGEDYRNNSFFKGRGYLRLDWIDNGKAQISIYADKDTKLASFILGAGETSSLIYIPGFYCRAGMQVRLDGLEAGVNRVNLEVDDNEMWLVQGEKFLDGDCSVSSINIVESQGALKGYEQMAISTNMKFSDLESQKIPFRITYNDNKGKSQVAEIYGVNEISKTITSGNEQTTKQFIQLTNKQDSEILSASPTAPVINIIQKLETSIYDVGSIKKSVTISCKGGQSKILSLDTPTTTGTAGATTTPVATNKEEVPKEVKENYLQAKARANDIEHLYGEAASDSNEVWALKAKYELGLLANQIGYNADAIEIFNELAQNYPDSPYATIAKDKIGNINAPASGYNNHVIRLLEIKSPEPADASASFNVVKDGNAIGADDIMEGKKFASDNFQLVKLYPDKVDLKYVGTPTINEPHDFTLSYTQRVQQIGGYTISLGTIKLKQLAKVSVISQMPNDYSEANFALEIGIEKRAIQLSPEKISEKIANLNASINKWEGIANKLGNLVSGMKGVCLATSAVLLVKNFFANLGGGATARQAVMPVYNRECQKIAQGDRTQFDECLVSKSSQIESDISKLTKVYSDSDASLKTMQDNNKIQGTDIVDRKKVEVLLRGDIRKQYPAGISYTSYTYPENTRTLTKTLDTKIPDNYLDVASIEQLRDLRTNEKILQDDSFSPNMQENANSQIQTIADNLNRKINANVVEGTKLLPVGSGVNWINVIGVQYFQSGKLAGFPSVVPIPSSYKYGEKEVTGFYVTMDEEDYDASGNPNYITIRNYASEQADVVSLTRPQKDIQVLGLDAAQSQTLINDAVNAIKIAHKNYGQTQFNLLGTNVVVNKAPANEKKCTDFMSPQDCKILFNVCDPVLCPSSRCDLGGAYRVDNVIASGIIGSIALCLPNFPQVIIPVCLSGIYAGLSAYLDVLKSYRDCLQEQLDTGKVVGICDEVQSIYLCEFFWKQAGPYLDTLFYKLIESSYGQGTKGGGEYLTVKDAYTNMQNTIDFIKTDYAVNSYKAFNVRSTADIGSEVCKAFVSTSTPGGKGFFDNLLQPDTPVQYSAWFDEIPYTTATVPATSQYKVFYMISAGQDQGSSFQVYLRNPSKNVYVNVPQYRGVASGFVPIGGRASETKDIIAPAGYSELCVNINGQDNCGFKKVSTDFAINYISDEYYAEQLKKTDITTRTECISGSPSLLGMTTSPNIEAGVQTSIDSELEKKGVIRICASNNPGGELSPDWAIVGSCSDVGGDVKCYLDKNSVKNVVKNTNIQKEIFASVEQGQGVSPPIEGVEFLDPEITKGILGVAEKRVADFDKDIKDATIQNKKAIIDVILKEIEDEYAWFKDLATVEEKANNAKYKAEAVYLKFRVYEIITKAYWDINEYDKAQAAKPAAAAPAAVPIQQVVDNGIKFVNIKSGKKYYANNPPNIQVSILNAVNVERVELVHGNVGGMNINNAVALSGVADVTSMLDRNTKVLTVPLPPGFFTDSGKAYDFEVRVYYKGDSSEYEYRARVTNVFLKKTNDETQPQENVIVFEFQDGTATKNIYYKFGADGKWYWSVDDENFSLASDQLDIEKYVSSAKDKGFIAGFSSLSYLDGVKKLVARTLQNNEG